MKNHTFSELGVTLRVPDDWAFFSSGNGPPAAGADAAFYAPAEHGYRSSVVLSKDSLSPSTPQRFEECIAGLRASMQESPDITVIRDGRADQNSMPAWILRYSRTHSDHPHSFEQLLVLLVTDMVRGSMLQIDASTISPLADRHLPVLMQILNSLAPDGSS
ncbi:MAG: hypothetical protein EA383_02665 [Spirochaetaceae bacterium]|nr:MAG: hypothetical protein EA383_02665 [Spirochaetaceae bacterium]